MKKRIIVIVFLSLFLFNFISAEETCDVKISELNFRLGNLESKLDTLESHYNLVPTIAQDVKKIKLGIEDLDIDNSSFQVWVIPGSIIVILIIILSIILARKKQ